MNHAKKAQILTYLGATPFIFALLIAVYDHYNWSEAFDHEIRFARFKSYLIAHTYGAVIVSFLAGIQWGVSMNQDQHRGFFIVSNLLALLAWFSLFFIATFKGVSMIAIALILAWFIDRKVYKVGLIPEWFYLLRTNISSIVLASLLLLLYLNQ